MITLRLVCCLCVVAALSAVDTFLPDDGLPEVVQLGAGSYASRVPRDQARRSWLEGRDGWGDATHIFMHMRLYVTPGKTGPVPSTDWWTSLVSKPWSGDLWAYPGVVRAQPGGLSVGNARIWDIAENGKTAKMRAPDPLLVGGAGFQPTWAEAEDWDDWMLRIRLPDAQGNALRATIAHGMPLTWFEPGAIEPRITIGDAELFTTNQNQVKGNFDETALGIDLHGSCYGLYTPAGTRLERQGGNLALSFSGKRRWFAIAVLPDRAALAVFADSAAVVPRSTRVAWDYQPAKGEVATTWTITTENLDGGTARELWQGWIPHHYSAPARMDVEATGLRYPTPRGELRLAKGSRFTVTFPFRGIIPEYPAPVTVADQTEAYRPELMRELINAHRSVTGYGTETYWGGKKILLFARYLEMARQLGMDEATAILRGRLTEALTDWMTFTPGEGDHFWAMYPNWGSLIGCRSRDNANPGVDYLQDHHMCYGYHVYAGALLALHDADFARDYGPMLRLLAKDYANWERDDTRFCTFRNLDPWCGHSWSGGIGGEDGNGQESSSEAIQGWGAMFVLGEALNDPAMRDAAAFGWAMETRATAEYYFDRAERNFPKEWQHPVVANLHTEGLGYWTWFSGNPFWMHAIQWLPVSPLLWYLAEDQEFAAKDFAAMWASKEGQGWEGNLGTDIGVGNITYNYLAGFDPDQAASVFHRIHDSIGGSARGPEAGPTYWRTQSLRAIGHHERHAWTDVPTSNAFRRADGSLTWVVYNTQATARNIRCFENGTQVATFSAPRGLSVMHNGTVTTENRPLPPAVMPATRDEHALPISQGCAVTASSARGNNRAAHVVDGDAKSRWESDAKDSEWIALDLGRAYAIERVTLQWEGAYGKAYDLQMSDDGTTWKTIVEITDGDGGQDALEVTATTRHLRLLGKVRGTAWGWSLFSFEVFGKPAAATTNDRIIIDPPLAVLGERSTARFQVFRVAANGTKTPVAATWSVDGVGSITADGVFTPGRGGTYDHPRVGIIAEVAGQRMRAWAAVEEARRVTKIILTPSGESGPVLLGVGETIALTASAEDQFGARIDQPMTFTAEGPLHIDAKGILTAQTLGSGRITATLAGLATVLPVEVVPPERIDLAAGHPTTASSGDGDRGPMAATDRDPKTRWESAHSDPQWIAVDLERRCRIDRMVLNWENAHAKHWRLEASTDGVRWTTIAENPNCRGKVETIPLKVASAQHLRLTCLTRDTGYGNSLWAFEAYGAPLGK